MKVLFAGTPDIAIPTLQALMDSEHEVVAVLTRTPARRGRGRTLYPSEVGQWAADQGLELIEADTLKDSDTVEKIDQTGANIGVVVAYGALIPQTVLSMLDYGWINLHFSQLPRWRGAAPVQRAIEAGDKATAIDVFQLEAGLETGPVYSSRPVAIDSEVNAGQLLDQLAREGATDVVDVLTAIEAGVAKAHPQSEDGAVYAHRITRQDLAIDFARSALDVHNHIRACAPQPGAYTTLPDGKRLKIFKTRPSAAHDLTTGTLQITKNAVHVGCLDQSLELLEVAPAGKSRMKAADWARGARLSSGARLGQQSSAPFSENPSSQTTPTASPGGIQ